MKKYIYLFILLFVGTHLLGQSNKIDKIQEEFNQAYQAFFDKDEKSLISI